MRKSILLLVLFLVGCASNPSYIEPEETAQPTSFSTIVGYSHTKDHVFICNFKEAKIVSIDNKKVKYPLSQNDFNYPIKVLPGKHSLVVANSYKNDCNSGAREGFVEFNITLKPESNYKLNGKNDDLHVYSWLEDSQGGKVSEVASAPSQDQAPESIITLLANN